MQVILLKDVKDLGKKDQIVNVSDGYGKNYLIPKGFALLATDGNINEIKNKQRAMEARAQREKDNAAALAKEMDGKKVILKVKAGENGKLFGAVGTKDIADALKEQCGVDVDKKKLVLDEPIKATGNYTIAMKIYAGISANVIIEVVAE